MAAEKIQAPDIAERKPQALYQIIRARTVINRHVVKASINK